MLYLIKFKYRCESELFHMCEKTLLVQAPTFEAACTKIRLKEEYQDAVNFENLTLE